MPFTLAHPAAVLPLRLLFGRVVVLPALVIGSMAPDLVYFVPLGIHGSTSHSLKGLFSFCLPVGFLVYLVFQLWLRLPLTSLLPKSVQERIQSEAKAIALRDTPIVLGSLLLGAVTHILWDSLTHAWSPWLSLKPVLNYELFSVGSYQIFVFRVLQQASTLLGFVFIAWWVKRWYRATEPIHARRLPSPTRGVIVVASVVTSVIAIVLGSIAGSAVIGSREGMLGLQFFLVKAVVTATLVYCLALGGYCVLWRWRYARKRR
jgi:Domain of unknown function (DUF4184)